MSIYLLIGARISIPDDSCQFPLIRVTRRCPHNQHCDPRAGHDGANFLPGLVLLGCLGIRISLPTAALDACPFTSQLNGLRIVYGNGESRDNLTAYRDPFEGIDKNKANGETSAGAHALQGAWAVNEPLTLIWYVSGTPPGSSGRV